MGLKKSFEFDDGMTVEYLKYNRLELDKKEGTCFIWFDMWKDRAHSLTSDGKPMFEFAIMCDDNIESKPDIPFDINSIGVDIETEAYDAFKTIQADEDYSVFPDYNEPLPQQNVKVACWNLPGHLGSRTKKLYDIIHGIWTDVIET